MAAVSRVVGWLENACLVGSAVALLSIMLLTTLDITLRKMTDLAVPGLYDLTQEYMMIAVVFLSISYVQRVGGHVRVTLFQDLIPEAARRTIQKVLDVIALIFLVMVAMAGWKAGVEAWRLNETSASVWSYPLAPALFMVPLGCGLASLRTLLSLLMPEDGEA
jgi:TRAP-type C4-dicarboxylate transport system permease small subunit